jgi:hypothetical protein
LIDGGRKNELLQSYSSWGRRSFCWL